MLRLVGSFGDVGSPRAALNRKDLLRLLAVASSRYVVVGSFAIVGSPRAALSRKGCTEPLGSRMGLVDHGLICKTTIPLEALVQGAL